MKSNAAFAVLTATLIIGMASAHACTPARKPTTVRLADFASPAELVLPERGTPRALVVLFAGSDVADLDGAIEGRDAKIVSRPLAQVADALACAGYASFRYNKRYVSGPTIVDRARFETLSGRDLADDGRAALAHVRALRPDLARLPVALFGWSEGSTVAMAVAAAEPGVRAVVLMAPVIEEAALTDQKQYARVGRPYLARYATAGALDADAVARAKAGPGGVLPQIFVHMFEGFRPGETLNPLLDTNHDGRIAFTEADPIIASWYADTPGSGLGMDVTGRALPGVARAFGSTRQPILILQGGHDAMVDPDIARAFANRPEIVSRVTFRPFDRLGHSLGPAPSILEDELLPMASEPLRAMTNWLDARFDGAAAR